MGKQAFEQSAAPGGVHHRLAQMAGRWEGSFRIWFEPGKLADESRQAGTVRAVLGGRFLLHEYQGSCMGEPVEGIALYGWHIDAQACEFAWAESFGTGTSIMCSEGQLADARFKALGSYSGGPDSPRWGWRTELSQPSADRLHIDMFNITPEGAESLAVEVRYERQPGP